MDSKKKENVEAVRRTAMEGNLKEYSQWEKRYFRNINEAMAREHGDRYNELKVCHKSMAIKQKQFRII